MDNESIRRLFNLSDDEFASFVEYQRKAEVATVLYCKDHSLEYFDFEQKCSECVREQLEFEYESEQQIRQFEHEREQSQ